MDSQSARGQKFGPRRVLLGAAEIDEAADRGVEAEAADVAAERDGAVHRAAVGIEHQRGAGEIVVLREQFEIARRVGGDGAARRNP